jgi:hypothetical protein
MQYTLITLPAHKAAQATVMLKCDRVPTIDDLCCFS